CALIELDWAVVGVVETDFVRVGRVHHVDHPQAVLVVRDEDVGPADFVVVRQTVPARSVRADRPGYRLDGALVAGLQVDDAERRIAVLRLEHRITPIRGGREGVPVLQSRNTGGRGNELGLGQIGDVVD